MLSKQEYSRLVQKYSPPSPTKKNCIGAFVIGGGICAMGQALFNLYMYWNVQKDVASALVSCTLIVISALLTGLGWYDNIAKIGGGGTLVPITGFANSVVSPALEFKSEGYIMGIGAKLFVISGPVIVYGTASAVIYGCVYWLYHWLLTITK